MGLMREVAEAEGRRRRGIWANDLGVAALEEIILGYRGSYQWEEDLKGEVWKRIL